MRISDWSSDVCSSDLARLHGLMREVEAAVEGMQTGLDGWRVVSLQFLRSRVVRDEKGPWAGLVQYRLRVMEESDQISRQRALREGWKWVPLPGPDRKSTRLTSSH